MAVVFMEGFDHVNETQLQLQKGWSSFSNSAAMVSGRFGGQAGACGNSSKGHVIPSLTTLIAGFAMKPTGGTPDTNFYFQTGAFSPFGAGVRLQTVTSGGSNVFKMVNTAGTQIGNIGTTPVIASTWYHVQIKLVVDASAGTIEVRLNGATTPEIVGTGLNTGSSPIVSIGWGASDQFTYLDDLWVVDTTGSSPTNTWLGDCRIETLFPNGNGANTAWTGVYTDWDDTTAQDGDSTYVYSGTPGDRETSTLTDLAVTAGNIYAVQTNLTARKDDAGTRTIAPVIRIGSTNYDGTTTAALSSSYLDYQQLYERLDPAGNAWSISTVNAMEAGVKEVA